MKQALIIAMLGAVAFGQQIGPFTGQVKQTGRWQFGGPGGGPALNYLPQLPQIWVDGNELNCILSGSSPNYNCSTNPVSPAISNTYVPPTYTLLLSPAGGTWTTFPGGSGTTAPACMTHSGSYFDKGGTTTTGFYGAILDMETCRTGASHVSIILSLPVIPTSETQTGCDVGAYCVVGGVTVQQTATTYSKQPLYVKSAAEASLIALGEPVCAIGVQDNVALATAPGLNNPDCTGTNMLDMEGPTNGTGPSGALNCNVTGVVCGITTVSVNTTAYISTDTAGCNGFYPCLVTLPLVNGYVSPTLVNGGVTTSGSNNGCGTGRIAVDIGSLHGTFECVTPQSGVNQSGLYATFTHAHGIGAVIKFIPNVNGTTGSFNLANGTATNISAYNSAQYMPHIEATGSGSAISFCSPSNTPCNNLAKIGPDHWEFDDLNLSPAIGQLSGAFIINLGNVQSATFVSPINTEFAENMHFRRFWTHGDWSSLSAGTNEITAGFQVGACYYCSLEGFQHSMSLRPGLEGHCGNMDGQALRYENYVCEGQSSGIFSGGFGETPATPTYVAGTNVQDGRGVMTFPYTWLGINCIFNPSNGTNGGNGCGVIPDLNTYWGGAGTAVPTFCYNLTACSGNSFLYIPCQRGAYNSSTNPLGYTAANTCVTVAADGVTLTYKSGPQFHDSQSTWPNKNAVVNPTYTFASGAGQKVACAGTPGCQSSVVKQSSWPQTCTAEFVGTGFCFPANPPTTIVLQSAIQCYNSSGATMACDGTTWQTFILNSQQSLVRKNPQEIKQGQNVLFWALKLGESDNSGGQNGITFSTGTRNTSANGQGLSYFAAIQDITILSSIFRNSCTGISMDARSASAAGDGGGTSQALRRISYLNTLHYNNSQNNPACPGGTAYGSQINTAVQGWIGNSTCINGACTFVATAACQSDTTCKNPYPLESDAIQSATGSGTTISVVTTGVNTFVAGEYANIVGTGTCLDNNPGSVGSISGNSFVMSSTSACAASVTSGLVQGPAGFQTFGMQLNDPTYIADINDGAGQCTHNGLAMPYVSAYFPKDTIAVKTGAGYAPPATGYLIPYDYTIGWIPTNTTVNYIWGGAGFNASTTDNSCYLSNATGNPQNVVLNHTTMVVDAQNPVGGGPQLSHGASIGINNYQANNIFFTGISYAQGNGGWLNNSVAGVTNGEGINTETFDYDMATFTACQSIFPLRTNGGVSPYQPYNANPNYNCSFGFPTFPSTTCAVGFNGTGAWAYPCTGNLVPTVVSDYHQYQLHSGSTYSGAGSDGLDLGTIMTGTGFNGSSLDNAFTNNFQCAWVGRTCPANASPFNY